VRRGQTPRSALARGGILRFYERAYRPPDEIV